MDVLIRSMETPELPFKGELRYSGIQVVTSIVGVYNHGSVLSLESFNELPKSDSIPTDVEVKDDKPLSYSEGRLVYRENVAETVNSLISLWIRTQNSTNYNYVLYEPNDAKYVVSVSFRLCYDIYPDDSKSSFSCRETHQYEQLPDSTPKSKIEGEFSDECEMSMSDDVVKFKQNSFFSSLISKNLEIELELTETERLYDLYELRNHQYTERPEATEDANYCPADISVSDGDYIIKCNCDDGPITFRFELTKFGTLPEWVGKRLDIDTLLNQLDQDETLIAEVKSAQNTTDEKWISELGDKELVTIK